MSAARPEIRLAAMTPKMRAALLAMGPDYQSPWLLTTISPQPLTRQAIARFANLYPDLVDKEWQDGCAQQFYYRLSPLGQDLKALATEAAHG